MVESNYEKLISIEIQLETVKAESFEDAHEQIMVSECLVELGTHDLKDEINESSSEELLGTGE